METFHFYFRKIVFMAFFFHSVMVRFYFHMVRLACLMTWTFLVFLVSIHVILSHNNELRFFANSGFHKKIMYDLAAFRLEVEDLIIIFQLTVIFRNLINHVLPSQSSLWPLSMPCRLPRRQRSRRSGRRDRSSRIFSSEIPERLPVNRASSGPAKATGCGAGTRSSISPGSTTLATTSWSRRIRKSILGFRVSAAKSCYPPSGFFREAQRKDWSSTFPRCGFTTTSRRRARTGSRRW